MNSKNTPLKPKKIPYYVLLGFLTVGASLILGFLSFSGMYTLALGLPLLFPIALPLAFAAFVLSVAYEGEIYLQNIKGALSKLMKRTYLQDTIAKEFLLAQFPIDKDTGLLAQSPDDKDIGLLTNGASETPEFFKDYLGQLKLLHAFGHKALAPKSAQKKRQIEKTLKDMEKWFAETLFKDSTPEDQLTPYAKELREWLARPENNKEEWLNRFNRRRKMFIAAKVFCVIAGIFMGLGTTYLIVEALSVIPVLAAIPFTIWPVFVIPMAIIAGAAYGFLTYNAITDMINNDTIRKWYFKLRDSFKEGVTFKNVFMSATAVFLVLLAVALTICTAGTWWTIASNAQPLFEWMKKIPSFVMGIINPIITGISALFFNFQNTSESFQMVDDMVSSKKGVFTQIWEAIRDGIKHVFATESWLQIINPFRLILLFTITPLRILLFLGHLASIAMTADRMPGIPQVVAAIVAIISEGFEDAHYFMGHSHQHEHDHTDCNGKPHEHKPQELLNERLGSTHGHNHNTDIPTLILKAVASPIYLLSSLWDFLGSKLNTKKPKQEAKEPQNLIEAKPQEHKTPCSGHAHGEPHQHPHHEHGTACSGHTHEAPHQHPQAQCSGHTHDEPHHHAHHGHELQDSEPGQQIELHQPHVHGPQCSGHSKPKAPEAKVLSFTEAFNRQWGNEAEVEVDLPDQPISEKWQKEQTLAVLHRYQQKHLNTIVAGKEIAAEKNKAIDELKEVVLKTENSQDLAVKLEQAKTNPVWNRHRHFAPQGQETQTKIFIDSLPERVNLVSST